MPKPRLPEWGTMEDRQSEVQYHGIDLDRLYFYATKPRNGGEEYSEKSFTKEMKQVVKDIDDELYRLGNAVGKHMSDLVKIQKLLQYRLKEGK